MIKKKNLIKFNIIYIFVFIFLLSFSTVFSAEIGLFPNFKEYRVGDDIKVSVNINSKTSVNAVSSIINFPKDILSISSISKSNSIISLWAREPDFSNNKGEISFEGVILNGFTGNSGRVVTLNFKAKREGVAEINFNQASILANDGSGTDVISGKNSTTLVIKEAIINTPQKEEVGEVEENKGSKIIEIPKETILKIKEIEKENQIPENYLLLAVCLLIILILIIIVVYGIYYILKFKRYIRKKLNKVEEEVKSNFDDLEQNFQDEILSSKIKFENTSKGYKSIRKIEKEMEKSEDEILEEIRNIEKEQ